MEANRLNAQKSTGPRSAEGKASSRFNAYKHGAYARARIIPGEDEADLTHLSEDYVLDLRPEGVVELRLVDTLIHSDWEQRRIPVLEAALIAGLVAKQEDSPHALGAALVEDASGPNVLLKLFRRNQAAIRDWSRAYNDFRKSQAERLSRPAAPEPGDTEPGDTEPGDTEPVDTAPPQEPELRNEPNPTPQPAASPTPEPPTPAPASGQSQTQSRNEPNRAVPLAVGEQNPQPPAPNPLPSTPAPEPPAPAPSRASNLPPTVASKTVPRGFNPANPDHPPIELCAHCSSKGSIQDRCYFRPRQPRK